MATTANRPARGATPSKQKLEAMDRLLRFLRAPELSKAELDALRAEWRGNGKSRRARASVR